MAIPFPSVVSALVWTIGVLFADPAVAARHALLVGVSDYQGSLPSLEGPRNDVMLVYRALTRAWGSEADIRVLADRLDASRYDWGPPAAELPTRAAILGALEDLQLTVSAGDEVLVYVSGHGSQSPAARDGEEADGLDEIFLPADFEMRDGADPETVLIHNHIRDDEIGAAVDRLVEEGVFVWLVIDACHSGTMERSADVARPRFVTVGGDAARRVVDLNISEQALAVPAERSTELEDVPLLELRSDQAGGFVAFYAAAPHMLAVEQPMPRTAGPEDRRQHGVMTWSLVQAIEEGGSASYGDLARRVTSALWEVNGAPQPMFAGNLGETPMLGTGESRTYGLSVENRRLLLQGGQIDGIAEGTILAVRLGEGDEEPLYFARVAQAGMERSTLGIIEDDPEHPNRLQATLRRDGLGSGARALWLWLEDRAPALDATVAEQTVSFILRVARPSSSETGSIAASHRRLVEGLLPAPGEFVDGLALEIVDATQPADLRLAVRDGRLWFLADLGTLITEGPRQPYSLPIEGLTEETLIGAFQQMAKSRNLLRVAERYAETAVARNLRLRLLIEPRDPDANGACEPPPPEEPARAPASGVEVSGFDLRPTAPVRVGHCDRVWLELRNDGVTDLDISPFYFGPHGNVYYIPGYRDGLYFGLKVRPGETRVVSYTENTASDGTLTPVGPMRLAILAIEGAPSANYASDFRHLAGRLPETGRSSERGDIAGITSLLDGAGFPETGTRAATTGAGPSRAGALIIPIETFEPDAG